MGVERTHIRRRTQIGDAVAGSAVRAVNIKVAIVGRTLLIDTRQRITAVGIIATSVDSATNILITEWSVGWAVGCLCAAATRLAHALDAVLRGTG